MLPGFESGDGKVSYGSPDNFDNRSTKEEYDTLGTKWKDISLSQGYSQKPGFVRDASFTFNFTIPSGYPHRNKTHYISFVHGDYDTDTVMKVILEGNTITKLNWEKLTQDLTAIYGVPMCLLNGHI